MAEVFDIYDMQGAHIGAIPISPRDRAQLHSGSPIIITYHTPRMLHAELGPRNGLFEVSEVDDKLIVNNVEEAKAYILLNADVERLMKQPNKWIDPDAKSDSPVR